eukprot:TRINITY_DN28078_c0_g1_i1.p1 TRINITY_DN28078_c0_g1~~TRINITY_DN28078_c0_g1_i1.p1  ORF type:complete len:168 (-),score=29.23 TRINITY_DN28078_c0_g1_i1:309-812(-)
MNRFQDDDKVYFTPPRAFRGASSKSRLLDAFAATHSACATAFALVMLLRPSLFGIFTEEPLPLIALDAIRWASPFVFGFGMLAALSLTMDASSRYKIALMYACCLGFAVLVGCYVQTTGRWNLWHGLNIMIFASLSGVYTWFLVAHPYAFSRTQHETLGGAVEPLIN